MEQESKNPVALVMGSDSDWEIMSQAAAMLDELGVGYQKQILSAHRTPQKMVDFAKTAHKTGTKVVIAGAGGAAHLPGMIAALSPLPVIGVPVNATGFSGGMDALLSIVQMPKGVPVATVAVGGAANAGILAAQILSVAQPDLMAKIEQYKEGLRQKVEAKKLP